MMAFKKTSSRERRIVATIKVWWPITLALTAFVPGALFAQDIDTNLLVFKGTWPGHARGAARGVAVSGNYAYLAATLGGLIVVDVSDPRHPVPVGDCDTEGWASLITVSGKYAFVGVSDWVVGGPSLQVIDISNPERPRRVGRVGLEVKPDSLTVSGNSVYMMQPPLSTTLKDAVLEVIDISDPTAPRQTALVHSGWHDGLMNSNGLDFRKDGEAWMVYDISNPVNPQRLGPYDVIASNLRTVILNNYAYVPCGDGSLKVLNVSQPDQPILEAWVSTLLLPAGMSFGTGGSHVAVDGKHLYMIHWGPNYELDESLSLLIERGTGFWLRVFDLSNPAGPGLVGTYDTIKLSQVWKSFEPKPEIYRGLAASGNYVYLVNEGAGLQIIDVSSPASPVRAGGYYTGTGNWAYDVAVLGNYAYLADGTAGLEVIDVSNPVTPRRVGSFNNFTNLLYFTEGAARVAVSGNYAFLVDLELGLQVIEVSNPAQPVLALQRHF